MAALRGKGNDDRRLIPDACTDFEMSFEQRGSVFPVRGDAPPSVVQLAEREQPAIAAAQSEARGENPRAPSAQATLSRPNVS
jgi:hypothetical protein